MNFHSDFTTIDLSATVGGATVAAQRVPRESGVYAFFRRLEIINYRDPDAFVDEVLGLVNQPAAAPHRGKCGPLHHVSLNSESSLSQRKESQLRELACDANFRVYLALSLRACTRLQAPLYVGKAESLRDRILTHLEPTSDLSLRLRDAGISIESCILTYIMIDDFVALTPSHLFLLEELVTRICRPGFVLRVG